MKGQTKNIIHKEICMQCVCTIIKKGGIKTHTQFYNKQYHKGYLYTCIFKNRRDKMYNISPGMWFSVKYVIHTM